MIDDPPQAATGPDGPVDVAERAHPRRAVRLLETCATCHRLFDLRTRPGEARGRYCSTTCLTIARRVRRSTLAA